MGWKKYTGRLKCSFSSTYLQAGRATYGIWTNTMEKGATFTSSDEVTVIGSKGGIAPDESKVNALPFSSIVWLCMFPSIAVRWYSSLVLRASFARGILITFDLCPWCPCLCRCNRVPLKSTFASTVFLPSRFISNKVIPCCKIEVPIRTPRQFLSQLYKERQFII